MVSVWANRLDGKDGITGRAGTPGYRYAAPKGLKTRAIAYHLPSSNFPSSGLPAHDLRPPAPGLQLYNP
ncbi:MAG: hypothetical protein K9I59_05030 [Chlorobium sp.]|uniref:hypothetical protein n=1 Tax=Chlorobium sp. TaxID=1095 RepID=UPI0025B9CA9B|nr:hypothetical protein [Chlorobium sp.]MCF8216140.1 hypothetical protein [Chlorobium sp.]MCF8271102.1 hypothetical protein [Chlorobium sp.]MCF8287416.1 hypothetical protein [Chlorobium sp.]MCF8291015.1 hypothetical protein [Chlorobium sp.]MCF8385110.1 hypothetical protein [Chlorobium sp.]